MPHYFTLRRESCRPLLPLTMTRQKKKKPAKSTKPSAVTKEGSLYRYIIAFFLDKMRPHVAKLGHQPTAAALDKRELLHIGVFSELQGYYNDEDNLKRIPCEHPFYGKHGIDETHPPISTS